MYSLSIGQNVGDEIAERGFAWVPRAAWSVGPGLETDWLRLAENWDRLEPDHYLAAGATFRRRRYGRFFWSPTDHVLEPMPHEPYFQPENENSYAGGIVRQFAPLLPATVENPWLRALVRTTFACLPVPAARRGSTWEVRVHQIRIVATPEEPGLPAPEGTHQDGTDFLAMHLVRRHNIKGGVSTIYDLNRNPIQSFTLLEPLDSLILEDPRVMHGVTPVFAADLQSVGTRDLLGLDFIHSPLLQRPSRPV
jgi:hypothetical protein